MESSKIPALYIIYRNIMIVFMGFISPLPVTGMGTIGLLDSVCLSVCPSVCLSVRPSVCPSVCHAFRVRTISPTPVGQILFNFT